MAKSFRRTPKNYDGTRLTSHQVSDLLPCVLHRLGETFKDRPDLILAAWPEVIGPTLASMTQAVSFNEGALLVKVRNSTLLSLLSQHDKQLLLQKLRKKFPQAQINNILFRIG